MAPQQPLNAIFAAHYEPIKTTLSQPARFPSWIVESAVLSAFAEAAKAGSAPDRQTLLACAVREAVKLACNRRRGG